VQYVAATGQTVTENGTGLPLTTDGELAWLQARTGNGVFVTSAAPTVLNATIDSGSVTDPSALTGADYTLQFNVAGGVTTYAVLKNGLPTAVVAAPYVSGQAITVDGMTSRSAARRRPATSSRSRRRRRRSASSPSSTRPSRR
jgi:flagellar hook-associated protein 3 FlgL